MLFESPQDEPTNSALSPAVVCYECSRLTRNPMRVTIGTRPCSPQCHVPLEQEALDVPVCSTACAQAVIARAASGPCTHVAPALAV